MINDLEECMWIKHGIRLGHSAEQRNVNIRASEFKTKLNEKHTYNKWKKKKQKEKKIVLFENVERRERELNIENKLEF